MVRLIEANGGHTTTATSTRRVSKNQPLESARVCEEASRLSDTDTTYSAVSAAIGATETGGDRTDMFQERLGNAWFSPYV